ncbi:MAG: hypothetical protein V4584_13560 [Verrucomicrobiota bacterium]
MSRISTHAITTGLIGVGALTWAIAGRPLVTNPDLATPLNPMGINGSPYGEVFAMAMQGPIDTYFDMGMNGTGHSHQDSAHCADPAHAGKHLAKKQGFDTFLASLGEVAEVRTNPHAAGDALKRHLRRQAEDKLRFAYQLDPAHYGNYNALHFFLTEPAVGTRRQLTATSAKLAEDTIRYCLKQENDPRPSLTAAAAATNILQLMFADQKEPSPKFNTAQMRQFLNVLDFSLARYEAIGRKWDQSKNWKLISSQRVQECQERYSFIRNIRDTCEKTIVLLEGKLQSQASN